MKNITLSADEHLIERGREKAKAQNKTLNQAFREWLQEYTRNEDVAKAMEEFFKKISYVNSGRKYTREEMNERR